MPPNKHTHTYTHKNEKSEILIVVYDNEATRSVSAPTKKSRGTVKYVDHWFYNRLANKGVGGKTFYFAKRERYLFKNNEMVR